MKIYTFTRSGAEDTHYSGKKIGIIPGGSWARNWSDISKGYKPGIPHPPGSIEEIGTDQKKLSRVDFWDLEKSVFSRYRPLTFMVLRFGPFREKNQPRKCRKVLLKKRGTRMKTKEKELSVYRCSLKPFLQKINPSESYYRDFLTGNSWPQFF